MLVKFSVLLGLALVCLGHDHQAISHQSIVQHHMPEYGNHGEISHIGDHAPEHHEKYAWSYPSYEFSYKVDDPYSHDNKGQQEIRDGDNVKGMYWLIQPDGRKRTVTYYVDKHSGFNAHVEYSDPDHHELVHQEHHQKYHHVPKSEVRTIINHLPLHHYSHYQQQKYDNPHYDQYYGHH